MNYIMLFEEFKEDEARELAKNAVKSMLRKTETFALVGGSESPKTLGIVLETLNSKNVLVVTSATAYKADTESKYSRILDDLGYISSFLHASVKEEADSEESLMKLEEADTVFFSGGDQSKISDCLLGSVFLERLKEKVSKGTPVAGTSAGAVVMAENMIAGGKEEPRIGNGLAMLPSIIVDSHFDERKRINRLEKAIKNFNNNIGLGISEDTAVIFKNGEILLLGEGKVTVVTNSSSVKIN